MPLIAATDDSPNTRDSWQILDVVEEGAKKWNSKKKKGTQRTSCVHRNHIFEIDCADIKWNVFFFIINIPFQCISSAFGFSAKSRKKKIIKGQFLFIINYYGQRDFAFGCTLSGDTHRPYRWCRRRYGFLSWTGMEIYWTNRATLFFFGQCFLSMLFKFMSLLT